MTCCIAIVFGLLPLALNEDRDHLRLASTGFVGKLS